jgi:hypothetical protein
MAKKEDYRMAKKGKILVTIDEDILEVLEPLNRKKSTVINLILRHAKEKGILEKIVQTIVGEEQRIKQLLEQSISGSDVESFTNQQKPKAETQRIEVTESKIEKESPKKPKAKQTDDISPTRIMKHKEPKQENEGKDLDKKFETILDGIDGINLSPRR